MREILAHYDKHPRIKLWRQNTGVARIKGSFVRFGKVGCGDISGVIAPDGRRIEVECKLRKGVHREAQMAFGEMIRKHGAIYVLAFSLEDVQRALGEIE